MRIWYASIISVVEKVIDCDNAFLVEYKQVLKGPPPSAGVFWGHVGVGVIKGCGLVDAAMVAFADAFGSGSGSRSCRDVWLYVCIWYVSTILLLFGVVCFGSVVGEVTDFDYELLIECKQFSRGSSSGWGSWGHVGAGVIKGSVSVDAAMVAFADALGSGSGSGPSQLLGGTPGSEAEPGTVLGGTVCEFGYFGQIGPLAALGKAHPGCLHVSAD